MERTLTERGRRGFSSRRRYSGRRGSSGRRDGEPSVGGRNSRPDSRPDGDRDGGRDNGGGVRKRRSGRRSDRLGRGGRGRGGREGGGGRDGAGGGDSHHKVFRSAQELDDDMELYRAVRDGKDVAEVKAALQAQRAEEAKARKAKRTEEAKAKLDAAMDEYRLEAEKSANAAVATDDGAPAEKTAPSATVRTGGRQSAPVDKGNVKATDVPGHASGGADGAGGAVAAAASAK
ncbi:hypothetical protein MMPV_004924 [Pyropia vietnamensis]